MNEILLQFKKDIIENMSGLIAFAITEVETGVSYLAHSNKPDFDIETSASYNLEVIKAKVKAARASNIDSKIVDILTTFEDQLHILVLSEDANYFILVAVDSSKTNLGMVKSVVRRLKGSIEGKL